MTSNSHRPLDESFPAANLVASSKWARRLARFLGVGLTGTLAAMLFAPWQQSVSGSGGVIAYAPADRQQTVDAPIKGRISDWDHTKIFDGARVTKGQTVLQIRDIDPDYMLRLQEQLSAVERELHAFVEIEKAYDAQLDAFNSVREQTVKAADEYVKMSQSKVRAEEGALQQEQATELQARLDFERQKQLNKDGLSSDLKLQESERKWKEASAKVSKAKAYVEAQQNELSAKINERSAKEREAQAKIESAAAQHRKALADIAKTEKELSIVRVKLAQQENQTVKAPRDGFILRMLVNQGGEMVKEGDPLFVLVPDTSDRAVEIWVSGNDAPLITPGRHARLQFEGWPAVQFAGWPSVAVGTFGGTVINVDAQDNGKGQFRVLVVPDKTEEQWPSEKYLRQGSRANGWVLLDEVRLGYEFWRRLNGFPQSVRDKEMSTAGEKKKT